MEVDQALRVLTQLKEAAPPVTAARLRDIIALLRSLDEQNPPHADLLLPAMETLHPSMVLMRAQSEALRSGRLGRVTTEQADGLSLIFEHATSALTLIDTLDEIALLRQEQVKIEPIAFSGLDLLAETWQSRSAEAEQRDHHITINADKPLPEVRGDYRRILSVLIDLLDNAVRYTPFGGMIRITAESLGTSILFSVADNGIGLSVDDSEQIGTPFWRAMNQTLVRQHPGTGLRLYRAKMILALHESDLLFSGEPGMGSTFSFTLPTVT